MRRYGTDKPDLRFGLELSDVSHTMRDSKFRVFRDVVSGGGVVKGFVAPGCGGYSRKQLDDLIDFARTRGASGLVTFALGEGLGSLSQITMDEIRSPVSQFFDLSEITRIAEIVGAVRGDLILLCGGPFEKVNPPLAALRHEFGRRLDLADPQVLAFAFVTDFPLVQPHPFGP